MEMPDFHFMEDVNKPRRIFDEFLDIVLKSSAPEEFACMWQSNSWNNRHEDKKIAISLFKQRFLWGPYNDDSG